MVFKEPHLKIGAKGQIFFSKPVCFYIILLRTKILNVIGINYIEKYF